MPVTRTKHPHTIKNKNKTAVSLNSFNNLVKNIGLVNQKQG
jgi:hypothetical protein